METSLFGQNGLGLTGVLELCQMKTGSQNNVFMRVRVIRLKRAV